MRRTLAVAVLALMITFVYIVLIWPAWRVTQLQQEWRSDAMRMLAHDRGVAASDAGIQGQEKRRSFSPLIGKLYSADSEGAALNMLQADLSALVTAVGAATQSTNQLTVSKAQQLTKIGLHATVTMNIEQLKKFMVGLNAHPRYIHIEQISVNAPQFQRSDENPTLNIDLEIVAFHALNAVVPLPTAQTVVAGSASGSS